ncbi:MAG: S41 family peptidase [Woeseiaceae bacterium]|nr:S41 family peptidase [Woeseiaceae bacterium]
MSYKVRGILIIVIGTALGFGLSFGGDLLSRLTAADKPDDLTWEQARLFAEVMERIKEDYVEPIDDRTLVESAIRGMVADLDAHSQYLDADEYQDIRISTSGSYSGVGIEVSAEDGNILVVAPIDGTPAFRAGIRPGDRIVAIDDKSVKRDGLQETIGKLRGRPGSRVSVSILRGPEAELLVYNLRRERIRVASVRHDTLQPSLGYVRISQFSENTASELTRAIDNLRDNLSRGGDELRGLVLDLRNNPGGILDSAVDVSDLFLDHGVIVTAQGRTSDAHFVREAGTGDILDGAPIVVLVNQGSASASEIVAGALQDHHRALIVGAPTFGKGLVQTVVPLSRGRAIKLTTSRYFTPSGDSIHDTGIEPDIAIDGDERYPGRALSAGLDREGDLQLAEAISLLASHRLVQKNPSDLPTSD